MAQPTNGDDKLVTHKAAPWLREFVRLMDNAFTVPGTRIKLGWDSIMGLLLPGAGDAASAVSHVALLLAAFQARVSKVVIARMVLNAAIDALVGVVPGLGDVFDVAWKANARNLELLERAERRGTRATITDYVFVGLAVIAVLAVLSVPIVVAIWVAIHLWR